MRGIGHTDMSGARFFRMAHDRPPEKAPRPAHRQKQAAARGSVRERRRDLLAMRPVRPEMDSRAYHRPLGEGAGHSRKFGNPLPPMREAEDGRGDDAARQGRSAAREKRDNAKA